MFVKRRRIVAEAEIDPQMDAPVEDVDMPAEDAGDVTVDDEATDLLFETEDVAQLVAEVTGQDVDVSVDDETGEVSFGVGQDEFTVAPEGDEEILEARRMPRKPAVKAATRTRRFRPSSKTVSASRKTRTVRRAAK